MLTDVILPMLAKPFPEAKAKITPGAFVAERKYNGYRMLARRTETDVEVWSRSGRDCYEDVPRHILDELKRLPAGIVLDGERILLTNGAEKHYDVSLLENRADLIYVVFDILATGPVPAFYSAPYRLRRLSLETLFGTGEPFRSLRLAESRPLESAEALFAYAHVVWHAGGEGLIIKNTSAKYEPGKRRDAFWKLKRWQRGEGVLVGFEAGTGTVNDRGPCATMIVKDKIGKLIRMKSRGDGMSDVDVLKRLESHLLPDGTSSDFGRTVLFDYTSKTRDGYYENPVFDRFEDE